jgi:HK97 family phage major capsid protein
MDRREALAKATQTRAASTGALLPAGVSRAFIQKIKDQGTFGKAIRLEVVNEPTGTINKITSGARLIRAAVENADDGYRAQVTFPTVPYSTNKIRLPWEVTEDLYHENLEGEALEAKIVDEMTSQFGLDLDDLDINGDTAAGAGPDQAFLQINDGVMKQAAALPAGQRVDAQTINAGAIDKAHFFAIQYAMPDKYRASGRAKLFMSPKRKISWVEALTARVTAAGDAILLGNESASRPLGDDIIEVPQFPADRILFTPPENIVRVVSWQVRKRKVTGDTDWELATRDKRGYIYFLKEDVIFQEPDAVIDLHDLDPPA